MNKIKMIFFTLMIIPFFSIAAAAQMNNDNMDSNMQNGNMQDNTMMHQPAEEMPIEKVGRDYEGAIIGKVLLVGDNVIRIQEDGTLKTYDIHTSQDLIANVESGYRVAAMTENGELKSITVLGMHKDAEPTVYRQ